MGLLERRRELETPFDTRSVHLEEGNAHDEDDDASDEGEDAFPDLLSVGPQVADGCVELSSVRFRSLARWHAGTIDDSRQQ